MNDDLGRTQDDDAPLPLARARGLELSREREAIRSSVSSLLARLRALGERLPVQAAPPPEWPGSPRREGQR